MNRIHVADFGRAQDSIDLEIAVRTWRRADANRLISKLNMKRIDIGIGINREGANAKFLAGADNPQRNFTAIGNQNFLKHAWIIVEQALRLPPQARAMAGDAPALQLPICANLIEL